MHPSSEGTQFNMTGIDIPYQPLRESLYDPRQLYQGFDPLHPTSLADTLDLQIYRHYQIERDSRRPSSSFSSMMQALHDHSLTLHRNALLKDRPCVAIMGGHRLARNDPMYHFVAGLSRRFTQKGFVVATGGGPGAMEAAHLGASSSGESDNWLSQSFDLLEQFAAFPHTDHPLIDEKGDFHPETLEAKGRWLAPAFQIHQELGCKGVSLAIPTWHYGHEPSTPIASHLAKYFQNSLREEGLLEIAHEGVLFAPGSAGTVQEIFQDCAQNHYRSFGSFSPMVFLHKQYWQQTIPVDRVLQALLKPEDYKRFVHFTDDLEEAYRIIVDHYDQTQRRPLRVDRLC